MSIGTRAEGHIVDALVSNPLFGAPLPVFVQATLVGGFMYPAGCILGRSRGTGLLHPLAPSPDVDGRDVPVAILCENIATILADRVTPMDRACMVAVKGNFNFTALVYSKAILPMPLKAALRIAGLISFEPGFSG